MSLMFSSVRFYRFKFLYLKLIKLSQVTSRGQQTQSNICQAPAETVAIVILHLMTQACITTTTISLYLLTLFLLPMCGLAATPLLVLCDGVDPPLSDEDTGEDMHPAGDLSEVLQDVGEQVEDRAEEDSPAGTSPPQVAPKVLTQLSVGDGERGRFRDWSGESRLERVHANQVLNDPANKESWGIRRILQARNSQHKCGEKGVWKKRTSC